MFSEHYEIINARSIHPFDQQAMQQTLQSPAVPSLMHVRISVVQLQALRKMQLTLSRRSWLLAMISI